MFRSLFLISLATCWLHASALAQGPNAASFTDPISVGGASLSPSGSHVAFINRNDAGEQIVITDLESRQAQAVQQIPAGQGDFDWVVWKGDDRLVAGVTIRQLARGRVGTGTRLVSDDLAYNVYRIVAFNRDGGNVVQMFEGQMRQLMYGYGSVFFLNELPSDPQHVLVAAWDNQGTGAWRANVLTGRVERVANGSDFTRNYETDGAGYPVLRLDMIADRSGYKIFRRANGASNWTFVLDARLAVAATNSPDFDPIAPGPGPNQVYVSARRGGNDLAGLYLYDTSTGEFGPPLQQPTTADISSPWINSRTRELLATCEFAQRMICRARDTQMQRHLNGLNRFFENAANVHLVNMSADGSRWLLYADGPRDPGDYYFYEPLSARLEPVARAYPNIDVEALSPTEIVSYSSRDGTPLWAYVTRRASLTRAPMIVMPHGGPEARDYYGYDAFAQFLASRGYVVVQPNFRGGDGFGRAFADAGRQQWGRRMQDDVTDAVQHMISTGSVDPERICIVGASYGGYAALTGVALTPDLYRCAVSIAGVSDLRVMLRAERASGARSINYQYWLRSIGDDREQLSAVSARFLVDRISAPVLLLHGSQDETVLIDQSQMMERALREAGKDVRLVTLEGENHYWNDWTRESRLTLFREAETFLAQHLGPAN